MSLQQQAQTCSAPVCSGIYWRGRAGRKLGLLLLLPALLLPLSPSMLLLPSPPSLLLLLADADQLLQQACLPSMHQPH
jgi:hypothetical protein